MRQRFVFGAVLAFAIVLLFVIGACGGSSSETPPPLQPDPQGFHYASEPPSASVADSDAGPSPAMSPLEDDDKPRPPARSTWGSKPAPSH